MEQVPINISTGGMDAISHVCRCYMRAWHALQLFVAADAPMAPPYGYSEHVLLPVLRQHLGLQLDMRCLTHGAFPKAICDVHVVMLHPCARPVVVVVNACAGAQGAVMNVHRAGEW